MDETIVEPDLVERLRHARKRLHEPVIGGSQSVRQAAGRVLAEAAEEIERLRSNARDSTK